MSNVQSILLYVVVFLVSYLLMRFGLKSKSRLSIFSSLGIISLLGFLRYGLGGDYPSYLELYGYYSQGIELNLHAADYAGAVEPMMAWLAQFSYVLTHTPLLYFGIPWITTVVLVYFGLRRLSKESTAEQISLAWLTLLPIITALGFNQIRQTLAAAILFFALTYLIKLNGINLFKYIVLSLLAILTHFSALFIALIYLVFTGVFNKKSSKFKRHVSTLLFLGITAVTVTVTVMATLKDILISQFPDSRYIQELYRLMLMDSDVKGLLFGVIDLRPENLIVLLIFLVPVVLFYRNKYTGSKIIIAYCALGLVVAYLSLFILNGERLSQYFIFFAPIAMMSISRANYNVKEVYACLVFGVIMFFGWQTVTRYDTIFAKDVDLNIVAERRSRALYSQMLCTIRPGECQDDELYDVSDTWENSGYGKDDLWRLR